MTNVRSFINLHIVSQRDTIILGEMKAMKWDCTSM